MSALALEERRGGEAWKRDVEERVAGICSWAPEDGQRQSRPKQTCQSLCNAYDSTLVVGHGRQNAWTSTT